MAQMPLTVCGIFAMLLGFVANSGEGKLPRLNNNNNKTFIMRKFHKMFKCA